MAILTKKIQSPAIAVKQEVSTPEVKAEETAQPSTLKMEIEALEAKLKQMKKEGGYDGGYGAPKDTAPQPEPPTDKKEDAVPGVPGTKDTEAKDGGKGDYDQGGYAAPKAEDKVDGDGDEDGDECECSACKGSGKMKKEKKEENMKEVLPQKEEVAPVLPKELKGLTFNILPLAKPTIEELAAAKNIRADKNTIFGITKKQVNSAGRQLTEWAVTETARLTPKV